MLVVGALSGSLIGCCKVRALSLCQDFYYENECIIREGATGDTFFIINKGEVVSTAVVFLLLFSFRKSQQTGVWFQQVSS